MKSREELKVQIQQKLAAKLAEENQQKKFTPPIYDEVFLRGQEWLDSLAGPTQEELKGKQTTCIQCAHKVYIEGFKLRCEETGDTREYNDKACTFAQTCEEVRAARHIKSKGD